MIKMKLRNEIIETKTSRFWIRDDGIAQMDILPKTDIRLENAQKDFDALEILVNEKRPMITDISNMRFISKKTREFLAGENLTEKISACAVVTRSPLGILISNFFLNLNKPQFPMKSFSSEMAAVNWLKAHAHYIEYIKTKESKGGFRFGK